MDNSYVQQATDAIYRIDSHRDLLALNQLIIQQIRALSKRATRDFVKNKRVQFRSSKQNRLVQGVILSVGRKNLRVLEDGSSTRWVVSAALCESI